MTVPSSHPPAASPPESPSSGSPVRLGRFAVIAAVIIVLAVLAGFLPRWRARRALAAATRELAVTTVEVVSPTPKPTAPGVPLPAEVAPYVEAPIYARANGYLKRWRVDLGAEVKAGDLLAEIDTPELDQQIAQAKAELAEDVAALDLSRITAERWTDLLKTASVSEQETAEKQADFKLKTAVVDAARANLDRLSQLKSFASVIAPFAGTITERNTDVGQLISAGNGRELFRLAQTSPLRVYVRVPQTMSRGVRPGQEAELTITELPGRVFLAKVVRTAGAMDPVSRTLLAELEVDNSGGDILAGSYAQVRFSDIAGAAALTLPANALLFRSEGMLVGVVGADGTVDLRKIRIGRDFGQTVEVLEGLNPSDRVIMNPPDSLMAGTKVRLPEPVKAVASQ